MRKLLLALTLILVLSLLFTSSLLAQEQLIIYHWWTAGGEREAINALFELYRSKYPGIKIVDNPVPGGAGVTMKAVMKALLLAGRPPDTFQVHAGAELKLYYDGGFLLPIDDVYKALNLEKVFPETLLKLVKIKGHYYSIPLNIHRANWLWYNKHIFDELGLKPPKTVNELLEVCKIIKEKKPKVWPLALGTRPKWPEAHLFEVLLLAVAGPEKYIKFFLGLLPPSDPAVVKTFEYLKKLLPYIYPYHGDLTWDEACGLLIEGKAAMNIMGDWALGYYLVRGWKPGVDFGAVAFPEGVFDLLSDSFGLPKGAPNPDATIKWLKLIASPEAQEKFNLIKGSIAARLDVPPAIYPDPIRRKSAEDLKTNIIVPSCIHGAIAPDPFVSQFIDTINRFLYSPDIKRAIHELDLAFKTFKVTEFHKGIALYDEYLKAVKA